MAAKVVASVEPRRRCGSQLSGISVGRRTQDLETLRTLAEIAVGFAGFASIVVAFRRRRGAWTLVEGVRYRVMLTNSLAACALALLPPVLGEFQLREDTLWALSSGLLVAYVVFRLLFTFIGRHRSANRVTWSRDPTLVLMVVAQLVLQLANILEIPIGRGSGPYVAGVALFLVSAGQAFFRLLVVPADAPTEE